MLKNTVLIFFTMLHCFYVYSNSEKNYADKNLLSQIQAEILITQKLQEIGGSFNLTISNFNTCKGPKHLECATASASVSAYSTIKYDLLVLKNTSPRKGKITAFTNGKEFLRLQMKSPCNHLFLRPLFQTLLNVTTDCIVLKGHYQFNVDLLKVAQTYYDGAFLFGNWTFKSIFYNNDCNFSCSVVTVQMSPKNKE